MRRWCCIACSGRRSGVAEEALAGAGYQQLYNAGGYQSLLWPKLASAGQGMWRPGQRQTLLRLLAAAGKMRIKNGQGRPARFVFSSGLISRESLPQPVVPAQAQRFLPADFTSLPAESLRECLPARYPLRCRHPLA